MKKLSLLIFALGMFFVSCEKDQDAIISSLKIENEKFTPSYTSISVECQLNTQVAITSVFVQYSINKDFVDYQEVQMEKKDSKYIANVDELQDNTTYYIRYSVLNRYSSATTEEISQIKTLQPSVPTITLKSISDIWDTHAKAEIALEFDGGSQISEIGICWNTQTAPVVENNKLTTKDTVVSLKIKDLQPNTRYFARAYAVNKVGVVYSDEHEFVTLDLPKVATEDITNIEQTSAQLNGSLIFNGNDTTIIKGFCWGEAENITINNNCIQSDTINDTFTYSLSTLKAETKYYVRAYAKNKLGIVYGEEKSFITKSTTIPIVATSSITNISYTSATLAGKVINDGGASVIECGVVYSTTPNPTLSDRKVASGTSTALFTCNITNLLANTTYYVRAYAMNRTGTSYGEQLSFTTKDYNLPTITTSLATSITYISAAVGGTVISDGNASLTEWGVVYSTTQNPTFANIKVTCATDMGIGSFVCNITNLEENTTYYVRAYAKNCKGTAYGTEVSFTTNEQSSTPNYSTENGHEYVDLGLSVKWATCNIGATSPEEYGDYFAWGETTPKNSYDWTTYKFCNGSDTTLTKYNKNKNHGTIDSINTNLLALGDDAAHTNWGGSWRMPRIDELEELEYNCIWKWTTQNGVHGYIVTSRSNGNSIFLPAAGINGDVRVGSHGYYWSNSLYWGNSKTGAILYFYSSFVNSLNERTTRCTGCSVRPVLVCP
ncbi:MAG: fibronectin type III domain-containing protein [Paludibacteraceae bacterium]|nr:fibronectin type III domain-containing protein [Paludibacteraceae bacterium]